MPSIYINENDISGSDQLFISNIYNGKILGEIMRLQDKTVNITTNGETDITFDTGYTGLNNVKVITNVPNPSTGTISITENAEQVNIKDYEFANVNVGSPYDLNAIFMNGSTEYAKVGVSTGVPISAPSVNPTGEGNFSHWEINGNVISFPYTLTVDNTVINAAYQSYTDYLYEFYNIDKTVCPYVAISQRLDDYLNYHLTVAFGTSITNNNNAIQITTLYTGYLGYTRSIPSSTPYELVHGMTERIATVNSESTTITMGSRAWIAANYQPQSILYNYAYYLLP